ncbi:hypothetical protein Pint_13737 [Pistacia integerrima]|uniref:Uncharacterized protein n=1 Tax=Pistacia integerrima TaxID=434235 RepID=A0ACC0Y5K8_9ROSI|nr:hypothetical protein Pint_13737 [Pistacia integerrima]
MNLSRIESANDKSDGNDNSQLLLDIEAISKALYLPKTRTKALISPNRSKSAERTRFADSKSKQNSGIHDENVLHKNKKSSLLWNWKKPLKALAHIGHNRFNICFFLHVHSIEGLPVNFNDINLSVLWKRKDKVLGTRQSTVVQGIAEFEEMLMDKCWVYGSRSGSHNSAKYEEKLSLILASVVEAPGVDIGKHWVDLTRLLPLTLEELEGEKSSGKWTTNFKLAGKAKGATLNVSFGFSVMKDNFVQSKNNMNVFATSNDNNMLRRVGSVPSSLDLRSALSSMSLDAKVYEEVSPILGLELSKSIKFLYEKLNEANVHGSEEFDLSSEHVERTNNLNLESAKDTSESESDNADFVVIEQGIEMSEKEPLKLEQSAANMIDGSVVEMINVDEIIGDDNIAVDENVGFNPKESTSSGYMDEVVVNDSQDKEITVSPTGSTMDELESGFSGLLISELADLESPLDVDEFLEQENYMDVKSNYRASKMLEKSLSLDDATESVASEFLNMLRVEHASFGLSSDGDPSSPRERLLREFEKETLASGNFILGFDSEEDQVHFSCTAPTGSGSWDCFQDFGRFPDIHGSEDEHKSADWLLKNRRKANILEDLETESLMREWGLNERAFQSSPRYCSDGFGSPVELSSKFSFELPALGDGFGPFVQTKGGGYLRSMSPLLFRNAKNVGSLLMQVSRPVVLPAEMGSEISDVLEHLASVGIKKLSVQTKKLMPLEDITGKTLKEVALEATPITMVSKRQASPQYGSIFGQDAFGRRLEDEEFQYGWSYEYESSGLNSDAMDSGWASVENFTSLAMDRIETLSIEGLRIQSSMSDADAPSRIRIHPIKKNFEWKNTNLVGLLNSEGAAELQLLDVRDDANDDELMDLSVTFDEWLKLDCGIIGDEDHINKSRLKILAAHHAKCIDLVGGTIAGHLNWDEASGKNHGLLGNNLTVALRVLLRDPLRNYEPVGTSMLALFQMERVVLPFKPKICSTILNRNEEKDNEASLNESGDKENEKEIEGTPWFKILEVHLAGLNTELGSNQIWGTKTQQQSGTRWLLASGMAKSSKHPVSRSKAIVISNRQGGRKVQNEDVLWSITSDSPDTRRNWQESVGLVPYIRNPDIVFPSESSR